MMAETKPAGNPYAYRDEKPTAQVYIDNESDPSQTCDRQPLQNSFDSNVHVTHTGGQPNVVYMGDQLCLSILVTAFCFWPVGIVAIMRASEARTLVASNDMLRAQLTAREARRLVKISFGLGLILWAFMLLFIIIRVA